MALQDDLAALLTSLQTDITNLAAGQQADQATITDLQAQLAAAADALSTAQTAASTAQATATADDAQLAAAQDQVTQLQQAVTDLGNQIAQFTPVTPPPPPPAAPTVTGVSPASGSDTGGDTVTVTGTGFTAATAVNFGDLGVSFNVTDDGTLTAVTTAAPDGTVDVTVVTPAGTSATSAADQFTFSAPVTPPPPPPPVLPTVTGVTIPDGGGNPAGGDSVAVTGTGFTGAAAVVFGTVPATNFTVTDDSTLTAISPAGTGTVDVTVVTAAGTSVTGTADQFSYSDAATTPPATGTIPGATPVPVDPNAAPVAAGTLPPDTVVTEVPAGVVPVVIPPGAVATTADSLPADATVTPTQ